MFRLAGATNTRARVTISDSQDIVNKLNDTIKANASRQGFQFISSFADEFMSHGICAVDKSKDNAAEKLDLPYKVPGSREWSVFDPVNDLFYYEKRQRWFRTFNDSYLSMYHFKENAYEEESRKRGNAFYLALRTLGGPLHPTAEGHAVVADKLYCAAAKKLLIDQEDAQCD